MGLAQNPPRVARNQISNTFSSSSPKKIVATCEKLTILGLFRMAKIVQWLEEPAAPFLAMTLHYPRNMHSKSMLGGPKVQLYPNFSENHNKNGQSHIRILCEPNSISIVNSFALNSRPTAKHK